MGAQRTTKGDLTADALMQGAVEQWATIHPEHGRVTVELFHREETDPDVLPMPWVVLVTITPRPMHEAAEVDRREYSHFRLKVARKTFAEKVREYRD